MVPEGALTMQQSNSGGRRQPSCVIIGAGLQGVCSAYVLARKGFQVTVVDDREGVALGTSFANAGMVCAALASPQAQPSAALAALKSILLPSSVLSLFGEKPIFSVSFAAVNRDFMRFGLFFLRCASHMELISRKCSCQHCLSFFLFILFFPSV